MMKDKDYNIEDIKQTFCRNCGGVKTIKIKGKKIPEKDWMKYGFACDLGCIC
jgi:hypothetical protein